MQNFEETKKLLDNSNQYYLITTNMQGIYTYANNYYKRVFGEIHGELIGNSFFITLIPKEKDKAIRVSNLCKNNPTQIFPVNIKKTDGKGSFIDTKWEFRVILDEAKQPIGIFGIGYDVTKQTNNNLLLENTQQILHLKNNILEEIAFNQSHTIRKPLANILGLLPILKDMDMSDEVKILFDMINESAIELDTVITDIINKTDTHL